MAIREYLEIDPRIKVLNERCRVFLDLAEILSDNQADAEMSYITWIIIVLIVISIIVTVSEVGLRFGMLSRAGKERDEPPVNRDGLGNAIGGGDAEHIELRSLARQLGVAGEITLEDLRLWTAALNERERAVVCGGDILEKTFVGI